MKKRILALCSIALLSGCATVELTETQPADDMIFSDSLDDMENDALAAEENLPSDIDSVNAQLRSINGQIINTKSELAKLQKSPQAKNEKLINEKQAQLSDYEVQKEALTTHKENLEMAETLE